MIVASPTWTGLAAIQPTKAPGMSKSKLSTTICFTTGADEGCFFFSSGFLCGCWVFSVVEWSELLLLLLLLLLAESVHSEQHKDNMRE
jgi:hypothetical protein